MHDAEENDSGDVVKLQGFDFNKELEEANNNFSACGGTERHPEADKIYLIEVGASKTLDDKELFYENFRICKISLEDDSTIEFLEGETGLKLDKSIDRKKALLTLLCSYLKEENFDTPNLFIQQHNISKYRDEWNSLHSINGFSNELPWLSFSMAASNRFSLIRDDNS